MDILSIGGTRGIFGIFVPGIFLLLNLGVTVYLLPFIDQETQDLIAAIASSEILLVVMGVTFGYLTGMLLRLLPPSIPDRLSAWWLQRFHKAHLSLSDEFPYFPWIERSIKERLPPEVSEFYAQTWGAKRARSSKQFFNFCKVTVATRNERAANEIYAAEALTRYLSGMFFALVFGLVLVLVLAVSRYVAVGQVTIGLIIVLCVYLLALLGILSRFRFLRIKEVETVFATSFQERAIFKEYAEQTRIEGLEKRLQELRAELRAKKRWQFWR